MSADPNPKPCPFCGNTEEIEVQYRGLGLYCVWCGKCGARGSQRNTERSAIRKWNACNKRKEQPK